MISIVKGKVVKQSTQEKNNYVDILTNSGVGYRVIVPTNLIFPLDSEVTLYTSFQVREDSQTLFGFDSEVVRDFFELLITVSGVGPKTGVSVLSTYSMQEVVGYINEKNHKELSRVSGLGSKSAQKIIVELENRVGEYESVVGKDKGLLKDLREALTTLGFSGKALEKYLEKGKDNLDNVDGLDQLIKIVLSDN